MAVLDAQNDEIKVQCLNGQKTNLGYPYEVYELQNNAWVYAGKFFCTCKTEAELLDNAYSFLSDDGV